MTVITHSPTQRTREKPKNLSRCPGRDPRPSFSGYTSRTVLPHKSVRSLSIYSVLNLRGILNWNRWTFPNDNTSSTVTCNCCFQNRSRSVGNWKLSFILEDGGRRVNLNCGNYQQNYRALHERWYPAGKINCTLVKQSRWHYFYYKYNLNERQTTKGRLYCL
jgi:hypothetical protein